MAKGKHIVVDGAFDQNLENDYHDLFANNVDLKDVDVEVDLDGVAKLDGGEMDGIQFDGVDFDCVDLGGVDLMTLREMVLIWLLLMFMFL